MKKTLSIIILGILIFSTIGVTALQENSVSDIKKIKEKILISKPTVKDENNFVTVSLSEGNSYLLEPNRPMLPTVTRVFTLPFGSKIMSVDVSYNGINDIVLSKDVKPAIEPSPIGTNIEVDKDIEIYDKSDIFPQNRFVYRTGSGVSDGEHVLFLTVQTCPIWYNPGDNILYYCDSTEIDISYYTDDSYSPATVEYDLVVISTDVFSSSVQELTDHKNNHGVITIYKDVDEIYTEHQGRDEPEQIKHFIKNAIENWGISYVLLVGSINHIPIRKTAVGWGGGMDLPTDLYYADIYDSTGDFCTWDSNNNNIFGEFNWDDGNIDDVDLYADVYIGRIPCLKNRDLNVVINKIINYENSAYGSDWYNKILLLGGDTFPNHGVNEGEFVTNLIAEEMDGFDSVKLWTSENTFKPLSINYQTYLGAGFISYSGHGYIIGFGTSPPDVDKRINYYSPYLFGMINGNKLPIVFFDACLTATLDYKFLNLFSFPAFAYNMVKKPYGGAVTAIGATRVGFTHVDKHGVHGGAGYLNLHFFKNYEEGITVSEMLTKSQNDYLNYVGEDCITLEEFIIIGDPSLKTGGYP